MINPLYLPEIREMLEQHDAQGLREFCTALHPANTAEFMEGLTAQEAWSVLQFADSPTRVEVFGYFEQEKQVEVIESSDRTEIGQLVADMPADDRVDLLNAVDQAVVEELLPLIPTEERRDILRLGSYPEQTAGALMTTEFAKLGETVSVREALEEIGRQAEQLETINYLYIVDDNDQLRGVVSTRQLVSSLGRADQTMFDLMERDLVTVNVLDDQEQMADRVAQFDLLAIPVVDDGHHLLGIITHDDVIDVVREEATEDAHRLGAVDPLEAGYLETHWFTLTRKRGVWLVILFFAALLTAYALENYEQELDRWSWLVLFIPLVISSGGNSGNQSATLIITALTTGNVTLGDSRRVVAKELLMGVCLGGFLAVIGYGAAWLLRRDVREAAVIPITILLVVMCGTLCGSILPLLFRRLGLDPALMSNPFVAGIIDIAGIVIYMNVALMMLG